MEIEISVRGGLHETEEWGEFKEQIQAQPYFVRNSCCATNGNTIQMQTQIRIQIQVTNNKKVNKSPCN